MRPLRVDAHVHAWSPPDATHVAPMLGARPGAPPPPGAAPALLSALDAASVRSALVVQPACYAFDHSYVLEAARNSGGRLRVCASVDPSLPAISAVMAVHALADVGEIAALRFNPYLEGWDPEEGLASDAGLAMADTAAVRGLPVCVMAFKGLAPLAPAINRLLHTTTVRIVLDHCGFVSAHDLASPDALALAALAKAHPSRLSVKASAWFRAAARADGAPGVDAAAATRLIEWLLQTVGPRRLLWGSDWPWQSEHGTYNDAWSLLDGWVAAGVLSADDAVAVGGGNAAGLFGFGADE